MGQPRRFTTQTEATEWIAQHFTGWAEDLDADEREAIASYKENGYDRINQALRAGDSSEPEVELLDRALSFARLPESVIAHRAVTANLGLAVGQTFRDRGYVSTSLLASIADGFVGSMGDTATRFEIMIPGGAEVGTFVGTPDLIVYQAEAEIMLPRNTVFRVVRQSTITELEVILK